MTYRPDAASLIWPGAACWHHSFTGLAVGSSKSRGSETGHTRRSEKGKRISLEKIPAQGAYARFWLPMQGCCSW